MFTIIADEASLFAQYTLFTIIVASLGHVSAVVLPVLACLNP
jgi:hypothetical protein